MMQPFTRRTMQPSSRKDYYPSTSKKYGPMRRTGAQDDNYSSDNMMAAEYRRPYRKNVISREKAVGVFHMRKR
jgi:hypothetical protein